VTAKGFEDMNTSFESESDGGVLNSKDIYLRLASNCELI
jgi:hypothetical protein